jgi:hypothetical protein
MGMGKKYSIEPGDVIGSLTVIRELPRKEGSDRIEVVCRCKCGSEAIRLRGNLIQRMKSGSNTSCKPCNNALISQAKRSKQIIDVGSKFYHWTVVDVEMAMGKETVYVCTCSCGSEGRFQRKKLLNGKTRSCKKCINRQRHCITEPPKIGDRHGSFTVMEEVKRQRIGNARGYVYICKCDCGSIKRKTAYQLRNCTACNDCVNRVGICTICGCRGHKKIDLEACECDFLGFCERCDKFKYVRMFKLVGIVE